MTRSLMHGRRVRRALRVALSRARLSSRPGSATVMVALTITSLLSLLALGIDLGALYNARSEAQRAADSAALAGASAFLEYQQDAARSVAVQRAVEFATSNAIRGRQIAAEDVTVTVDVNRSTVRAYVRRDAVPTWFARVFGVDAVDVGAEATAWAGAAGAAQCVKPFAIPDMWDEKTQDVNGNRLWDEGERWKYEPSAGDFYARYSGDAGSGETGYGSTWRDGRTDALGRTYQADYGRRITVKMTDPKETWTPSFFLPWVLPPDDSQASCGSTTRVPGNGGGDAPGGGPGGGPGDTPGGGGGDEPGAGPGKGKGNGGGLGKWIEKRKGLGAPGGNGQGKPPGGDPPGGDPPGTGDPPGGDPPGGGGVTTDDGKGRGAARYRQNICSCNASVIDLDTEYMIEPGNMVGPTYQGVRTLIEQDPDAYWDDRSNTLVSEYGMDSPRVVTVALFDPAEISKPGRQHIRFNNFARIFIEEQSSQQSSVTGRLLYYVPGVGTTRAGATTGSLVRTLQLIR
jgi:Flp pilus assembly protein TadG